MDPLRVGLILLAAWALYLGLARLGGLIARPWPVEPARPTRSLPDDASPAVVNFLVNGCRVDPDAIVATLIDLAARGYVEIEHDQVDPARSLVRALDVAPPDLTTYERRVLDRVIQAADLDGTVVFADLAGRQAMNRPGFSGNGAKADLDRWAEEFGQQVAADAKEHGYLTDRPVFMTMLVFLLGMVVAGGSAVVLPVWVIGPLITPADLESSKTIVFYVVSILVLSALLVLVAMVPVSRWLDAPHRTRAGRKATVRWLGVEAWLRLHEDFTDAPPAAVTQWSRYLSYATALGITPTISQSARFATGAREVLWSRRTGGWRQLPVAYPRRGRRFAASPPIVIARNLAGLAVIGGVAVLTRDWWRAETVLVRSLLAGTAALIALRCAYRLLRATGDGLGPVVVSGEVLAVLSSPYLVGLEERRQPTSRTPWRRPATFLVIDDGRSARARLWRVASSRLLEAARYEPGSRVRLIGYPWTHVAGRIELPRQVDPPTAPAALPELSTIDAEP